MQSLESFIEEDHPLVHFMFKQSQTFKTPEEMLGREFHPLPSEFGVGRNPRWVLKLEEIKHDGDRIDLYFACPDNTKNVFTFKSFRRESSIIDTFVKNIPTNYAWYYHLRVIEILSANPEVK